MDSLEYDSLSLSLDLYFKLFLANVTQHIQSQDEYIWLPQITTAQTKDLKEGKLFGFEVEIRTKMAAAYMQYINNCLVNQPSHKDIFVTAPFIIAVLNSNVERCVEGSAVFIQRIDK